MNTKNGKIRIRISKDQIVNCYDPNKLIFSYLIKYGIPVDESLHPKNGVLKSWHDEMTNEIIFEWIGNLNHAGNRFCLIPKKSAFCRTSKN